METDLVLLDCTLRDGGYYNSWNFSKNLIQQYLHAINAAGVDVAEFGFRSLKNEPFKGACAFTTDEFLRSFVIPPELRIAVMVNGTELVCEIPQHAILQQLFPNVARNSPVAFVRIACHAHEFIQALPATIWLKERGYQVGFNLMQVADRAEEEIENLCRAAAEYPIDVLYLADSKGSLNETKTTRIIRSVRRVWDGPIGIHTHDNLRLALSNTLRAIEEGANWADSTVAGMGRGPGNSRTEELTIEFAERRSRQINLIPLLALLRDQFRPMQIEYGWGTNPYYYFAGKYGIHPSHIQEMLRDPLYNDEDVLAAIDQFRVDGVKNQSD